MNEKSLISIITPAYNAGKYIAETIDSVKTQSYTNWELIIVDDCSTDNTANIVKQYQQSDSRIKYFKLENNSGVAGIPRNYGIQRANGDYIAFIDADDLWLPEKLEKQIAFLQKTNADLVYTNLIYFYPDGKESFIKTRPISSLFALLMRNPVSTSSVLVKKTKDLFFDPSLKVGEDQVLWSSLFQERYSIQHLDEFLIRYRYNRNSLLHKSPLKSLIDGYNVILKVAEKYNFHSLKTIGYIISQTVIRTATVLIGISKRKFSSQ